MTTPTKSPTQSPNPAPKPTLQQRLSESIDRHPDRTAIEYGEHHHTYGELSKRSDRIARGLIAKNIKKETPIGVLTGDRVEIIQAMLGILKAGGIYIPLETANPDSRLEVMIDTTHIRHVIGNRANIERLTGKEDRPHGRVELMDIETFTGDRSPSAPPELTAEDKIYIYFTSGTTGTPKAIVGRNKSLLHYMNWEIDTFEIDRTYRVSQLINPGFDAFLRDTYVPLLTGGTICIPEDGSLIVDSAAIIEWIDSRNINLIHSVPSQFRQFNTGALKPGHFKSLKYVLQSGERIIPGELKGWYETFGERIELVNLYGPSETTLVRLFYRIRKEDVQKESMPIGKPMRGVRVIILNEKQKVCRPLESGEIYIRTPYRTAGYYNDPELNAAKFVRNPFNPDPKDKLFRTGDIGRFLMDGNIELQGRIDRMVKVRGIRIELDEVENALLKHPALKEAVVVKQEVKGKNEYLAAVITRAEGHEDHGADEGLESELKARLAEKMPEYSVPNYIMTVDNIPRKPNGKVDYDGISEILVKSRRDDTAPRTPQEEKLVKIWEDLLGYENIGINSSFFELGGNSLVVMNLMARIHKEFEVEIQPGEVFRNNTVKQQAQLVAAARKTKHYAIAPAEKKEYYTLSPAQKRLYVLQMIEGDTATNYNMPRAFELEGPLDKARLEEAFKELIQRHEALRTSFRLQGETPVQVIHDAEDVEFAPVYKECDEKDIPREIGNFIKSFDMSKAPLFRAEVIKINHRRHMLAVDIHHIIADDSYMLLLGEILALYAGQQLEPLKIHYKDYAGWHARLAASGKIEKQEAYWLKQLGGQLPTLNLSTDHPRPAARSTAGDIIVFGLDREASQKMRVLNEETGTTIYMVLLAAYNILLAKYAGQEEIIVGSPVSGRNHRDLENVIGTFANMVAMRNKPQKEKTVRRFLEEVKTNALAAYENQDYQFEELLSKLGIYTPPGRTPLFDVVINMGGAFHGNKSEVKNEEKNNEANNEADNEANNREQAEQLKIKFRDHDNLSVKYDLLLRAMEAGEGISLALEYSTTLFKRETAERIVRHFAEILDQLLENKDIMIKDINTSYDVMLVESASEDDDVAFNF